MKPVYNRNKSLAEIFQTVKEFEGTLDDKAKLLKGYTRKDVRWYVDFMYNRSGDFLDVPEFKYSNRPHGVSFATINTSIARIEAAVRLRDTNPEASERNILRVLEIIPNDEADLLVDLFRGRKVDGISKAVFKRAYPDLFIEPPKETDL